MGKPPLRLVSWLDQDVFASLNLCEFHFGRYCSIIQSIHLLVHYSIFCMIFYTLLRLLPLCSVAVAATLPATLNPLYRFSSAIYNLTSSSAVATGTIPTGVTQSSQSYQILHGLAGSSGGLKYGTFGINITSKNTTAYTITIYVNATPLNTYTYHMMSLIIPPEHSSLLIVDLNLRVLTTGPSNFSLARPTTSTSPTVYVFVSSVTNSGGTFSVAGTLIDSNTIQVTANLTIGCMVLVNYLVIESNTNFYIASAPIIGQASTPPSYTSSDPSWTNFFVGMFLF